jgi:hypothetical protein
MNLLIAFLGPFTMLMMSPRPSLAQTDLQKAQNLTTCLTGRYPSLCRRDWLTSDERTKVEVAEQQQNLQTCLSGRYPTLCKKGLLSQEEQQQVLAAEKRENLKTCLMGRYKLLCKKNLLTDSELRQTLVAERAENLRTCLTGMYPRLCERSLLSSHELAQVQEAEKKVREAPSQLGAGQQRPLPTRRTRSSGCEAGHWVESVSSDGQIVKLEDGSIWEVDPIDRIDAMLWLPVSEIVACADKLINTDDNETVSARRIR